MSMNRKRTYDTTTSSKKSVNLTQNSSEEVSCGQFQLDLQVQSDRQVGLQVRRGRFNKKCETERPLEGVQAIDMELVLNGRTFWVDCSNHQELEKQLQLIFETMSIQPKIFRQLKIVLLSRWIIRNSNLKPLLSKILGQFEEDNLKTIEETLQLQYPIQLP